MAVKRFGANHVLGIAMIAWSIITLCTGFIQTYHQAIAVRVLLGAFEAGLVPSIVFIISTIWERERQSKRVAIIYGANCLSGAFGGLIAVSFDRLYAYPDLPVYKGLLYAPMVLSCDNPGVRMHDTFDVDAVVHRKQLF